MNSFTFRTAPLVAAILWAGSALPLSAGGGAGSTSANFLKIGMGARAAAMGDAFTPVANDSTAVYWNPAGMMLTRGTGYSLSHAEWMQDVRHEHLSVTHRKGKEGAYGGSLTYLGVRPFRGALETVAGEYGGVGDTISAYNFALSLAYAQRLGYWKPRKIFNKTLLGFKVTFLREKMVDTGATGMSMDIGGMYEIKRRRTYISLVLGNLGTSLKGREQPAVFTLGASHQLRKLLLDRDKLTFAFDTDSYNDTGARVNLGTEYLARFGKTDLALRGGYRTGYDLDGTAGVCLGAGVLQRLDSFDVGLDYALAPYGVLGTTHRVTLNLRTGGGPVGPQPVIESAEMFKLGEEYLSIRPRWISEEAIANWRVTVSDLQNRNAKVFSGKGDPPGRLVWDGKREDGTEAPPGVYRLDFRLVDDEDETGWAEPRVVQARKIVLPPKAAYQYQFQFSGDLLFDSGKSELQPRGYEAIERAAKAIQERYPDSKVLIAGHTDNMRLSPTSPFKSNQELSVARAQAVKDHLVKRAFDETRLSVTGYGENKPIAPNTTAANLAKNRRVELIVYGEKTLTIEGLLEETAILMRENQYSGAVQQLQKAVELDPNNAKAYKLLGNCRWHLGDKTEAMEAFRRALYLNPEDTSLARWVEAQGPAPAPAAVPVSPVTVVPPQPPSSAPAP